MSDTIKAVGSCLCGAVTLTADANRHMGACHCNKCRTWGGGPLMATDCGSEVSFEGAEHVEVFDSSAWADRGFCGNCGTHLYYRLKQTGQYIVPAGLLGDAIPFEFTHQVFIDENPSYYRFANETRNMTGKEIFEKYGA